jgi:hypothetical protein
MRLQRFDESLKHFVRALSIQQNVYGGDAPHLEIATTYGEMGKMEKKRGDKKAAMAHFQQQRRIIEDLLGITLTSGSGGRVRGREPRRPSPPSALPPRDQRKLEGQLLGVLLLMRTVFESDKKQPCGSSRAVTSTVSPEIAGSGAVDTSLSLARLNADIAMWQAKDPDNSQKAAREEKAARKKRSRDNGILNAQVPSDQLFRQVHQNDRILPLCRQTSRFILFCWFALA